MTSHSARTMREVSETVVIYTCLYSWNKFLVQIPWKGRFKSGKSSVLQARNRSFVRRGFRRKVPFFLSSTKLSEVVQDIAFDALAPDCSIQVLPISSEVLSAIFMSTQLPGNRVFFQSHCLSKVCVPAKELFFVGFLPSASQTHRGCGQSFAIWGFFLALVWWLLCKLCNHPHSKLFWLVAWRMCGSARERAAA